jgi:hypothetical protein
MIAFQLVVQHRAAGVLTSTNFNLDALVVFWRGRRRSLSTFGCAQWSPKPNVCEGGFFNSERLPTNPPP